MQIREHQLSRLSSRFNLMVFLVFGLLSTDLVLGCLVFYTNMHKQIEVTPFSGGKSYSKSEMFIDSYYLTMMSENFIYERLNISPETVNHNHKNLLSFVDSASYADFISQLQKEAKIIIDKKISSYFEITSLDVNEQSLSCNITGILRRSVGVMELPTEQMHYQIQYRYKLGRLSIIKFNQLKEGFK